MTPQEWKEFLASASLFQTDNSNPRHFCAWLQSAQW